LGSFHAVSDPCSRGVKIAKIAITTERGARSLRPFGQLFWYVFPFDSPPSRANASTFPASGDVDVFLPCFLSYTLYVPSFRPARYSRILEVNMSGRTAPTRSLRCRGRLCASLFRSGPDLVLECLNRSTFVRAALGIVFLLAFEGFHVFLRVWGEYSLFYRCFLLKLALSLYSFISNLPAYIGRFLGRIYV